MLFDYFIFFNEVKLLEFRLKELYDSVDYFIIIEANTTHAGEAKPSFYLENIDLFKPYEDKIIHRITDLGNLPGSAWHREYYQRNYITEVLEEISASDDDIIVMGDVDEIPDSRLMANIRKHGFDFPEEIPYFKDSSPRDVESYKTGESFCLIQQFFYYRLECKCTRPWYFSKIVTYRKFKEYADASDLRLDSTKQDGGYHNAGWHFSYFGGSSEIITKLESFAHQEMNNDEFKNQKLLDHKIRTCEDILDRGGLQEVEINPEEMPVNYKMLLL